MSEKVDTSTERFAGHTPGPWRVICGRPYGAGSINVVAGNEFICEVGHMQYPSTGPDGNLLAAAPTLLAERDALAAENARLREELEKYQDLGHVLRTTP